MKYIKEKVDDFPFTHAIAVALLIETTILIVTIGASPLGHFLVGLLALFVGPGATLMLLGLQWRGETIIGYGIESAGHMLMIGGWIIQLYILIAIGAVGDIAVPIAFAAAHVIKIVALRRKRKRWARSLQAAADDAVC